MIQFLYNQDQAVADFVAKRIGMPRGFWPGSKTIGIVNERNEFMAGIVYHHWNPEDGTISMSGAALTPRWAPRHVLQRIFDYPFHECRCQMVLMQLRASDVRLQRQLATIGFAFDKIRRLYGRHEDGIIATLTDEDWRDSKFNRHAPVELEEAA